MVRDAIPYLLIPLLLAAALWYFGWWPLALACVALAAFMAYFFRDPERTAPDGGDLVLAPADGRVTRVRALDPADRNSATLVSIFLSPLDVHINRAPISGVITAVQHTKGKFLIATNELASTVNEQNSLTIEGEKITVVCKQVAGVLARRIVCWKKIGDRVQSGERFGLIKFSSRTDLILPPEVAIEVAEGARVRGGVSVIGRIQ
ncbi:MAG TPA: phosphatidylserine decarboxylase [Pyrinomonadaceae bacterium]|jgi:phosphatidylserine decarboxylase|nr:phosphatidylserine decarboxylase [Pyrinomonadaceae bacterium]